MIYSCFKGSPYAADRRGPGGYGGYRRRGTGSSGGGGSGTGSGFRRGKPRGSRREGEDGNLLMRRKVNLKS